MDNLELYNKVRSCPKEALKAIQGGKLKGMSDINPMWRIKVLTENFGVCGFGWKTEIEKFWTERSSDEKTISAFVIIKLFIRMDGEWSEPITGVGGSSFAGITKNGIETSDECYKMAYTDAISVACKQLGIGADVYWDKDRTKYDQQQENSQSRSFVNTPNKKKTMPREKFADKVIMDWIYKKEIEAKAKGVRFSIYALIEKFYSNTKEDIEEISNNYFNYKTNNNLL